MHDSLLPEYRGFSPLNWAIINGEDHTGVSLFYLDELTDGGDIVAQKSIPIGLFDTAPTIYDKVCQATIDVIIESLPSLASGNVKRNKQEYSLGSFTCKRNLEDGIINWSKTTREIYNKIRALTMPYPGAFTFYNNRRLIIWDAEPVNDPPNYIGRIPGCVVKVLLNEGSVEVLTGDGIIRIKMIQYGDDQVLKATEVINSIKVRLGASTEDLITKIQYLENKLKLQ